MRLALKHRRIPYAGLLYRGLTCVITAPTSQTMGRAHRRSFLKFVIGTLFHKPAPETRNAGYRREIGENSVENSCLWSGSYTYRISESSTIALLVRARSRFPARLIILRAGNECLLRVISFPPRFFLSRRSHSEIFRITNAQTSRTSRNRRIYRILLTDLSENLRYWSISDIRVYTTNIMISVRWKKRK